MPGFKTDLVDKAALLAAQEISRAPDIQIAHGQVEPAPEVREFFDGLQPLSRFARESVDGRNEQVAEGFPVRTPDAPAKLVQLGEAEPVRPIDDDRIGVGYVQAVLDDAGAYEYVESSADKIRHDPFQLAGFHLPVRRSHAYVRGDEAQGVRHFVDIADVVVQKKDLSAPADFVQDGVPDQVLVEGVYFRIDRLPVRRRRGDERQIPGAQQRELKRSGDGRCGKGKRVHFGAQFPQALLDGDPEALLLVDNEQPQVFEPDILRGQPMRTHYNVHAPFRDAPDNLFLLGGGAKTRQHVHMDRIFFQPCGEGFEMLRGQDGRRREDRHLFAILRRLERRPDGDFRFAEPDVSADQPIHGRRRFHIGFYGVCGGGLVRRIFVAERGFHFPLPDRVRRESDPGGFFSLCVERDQVPRNVLDLAFGAGFRPFPLPGTQFGERGRPPVLAGVLVEFVERIDIHVQDVLVPKQHLDGFLLLFPHCDAMQPGEAPDSVIHMDHEIAGREVFQRLQAQAAVPFFLSAHGGAVVAVEYLMVRVDGQAKRGNFEPFVQRFNGNADVFLRRFVVEEFGQARLLSPAFAEDERAGASFGIVQDAGAQQPDISIEIRLRGGFEPEDAFACGGERAKQDPIPAKQGQFEGFAREIPRSGGGRFGVFALRMAPGFFGGLEPLGGVLRQPFFVCRDEQDAFGKLVEDRCARHGVGEVALRVWNEAGRRQATDGSLRPGVEFAQGFDVVAEEFRPDGPRAGERIDVEDAAPKRYFSGPLHELDMFEPRFHQSLRQVFWRNCHARSDGNRAVSDRFRGRGHFRKRLDARYDQAPESVGDLLQHIGSGDDRGQIIQLFVVVGFAFRGRELQGAPFFLDQLGNVAKRPGGYFLVWRNVDAERVRRLGRFVEPPQQEGRKRSGQPFYLKRGGGFGVYSFAPCGRLAENVRGGQLPADRSKSHGK